MNALRITSVVRLGSPPPRAGVTLPEVLMSLMIMSIGVVMVITVFPLATLRVLEASKQTNSTIARFSVEPLVDVDPSFLHNPDGYFDPGGTGADISPYNSAITTTNPAFPTFRGRVYWVDPYGWQTYHRDNAMPALLPYVPLRDTVGAPLTGSGVTLPTPQRYTGATMFASAGVNPYPTTTAASDLALERALQLVGQPDNWKTTTEALAVSATNGTTGINQVTLDNEADFSSVKVTTGVAYRAVIFDIEGKYSETRILTSNPAGQSLTWTPDLPVRFNTSSAGVSPNVGKVRVEQLDEVYTCAMSVRKRASGPANVDVVVYFKRSFKLEHDAVYAGPLRRYTLGPDGAPGVAGVDDNGNGSTDEVSEIGYPGSDDVPNTIVTINYSSLPAGSDPPALRKGAWLFDTRNGLWYRIQNVQNETSTTTDVVLDRFIQRDGTEDLNNNGTLDPGEDTNGNGTLDYGGVIVNPTVANVFPLEIKEP